MNWITLILKVVPVVVNALAPVISRASRPAKPIPFGRPHFWDGAEHVEQCVYCRTYRTNTPTDKQLCPGPALH